VQRILMLIYHCPTTTRIVRTSIEASEADLWRFRSLKLSLWCPHCQIGHSILAKDTQLDAN
jgi:cytochrome c-type biogenesis protein CcmH/NrfF